MKVDGRRGAGLSHRETVQLVGGSPERVLEGEGRSVVIGDRFGHRDSLRRLRLPGSQDIGCFIVVVKYSVIVGGGQMGIGRGAGL